MTRVTCHVCHREERWTAGAAGPSVDVILEGGGRRPAIDPQWQRGRTALQSVQGEIGPVVGMCEACGQLLVAEGAMEGVPSMLVRIDTPQGALLIDRDSVEGPTGPLTPIQAEAFLAGQYKPPMLEGMGQQVMAAALLTGLIGPFLVWVFAVIAVTTFLLAVYQGMPGPVASPLGYDENGRTLPKTPPAP